LKTFFVHENELNQVVSYILTDCSKQSILLLYGDLGTGKTTLTKAILAQLGIKESITSPTFNIVSTYQLPNGHFIHHFDLYRIKSFDELYEIGFEEYLDAGQLCLIEWPTIGEPFYQNQSEVLKIEIVVTEKGRTYLIQ